MNGRQVKITINKYPWSFPIIIDGKTSTRMFVGSNPLKPLMYEGELTYDDDKLVKVLINCGSHKYEAEFFKDSVSIVL